MRNQIEKGQSLRTMESIILQALQGKQLWGDINLSIDEYKALRDRMKELLLYRDMNVERLAALYPVAMTSFLVFLARYKFNTNFWGLLSEELSSPITGSNEAELGAIVRQTFKKYGFDFSDVKHERRVNLEPIFYEAGLPPESSLDDLFYILNYDSHTVFDPQLIIEDLVEMRSYQIRKPMLKFLKRFKGDRAVEFVMDVHEAMLCVDQSMASDSHYVGNYSEWKSRERTKETISSRKKQEFQTKPYLAFDNGNRGLCLVLPRVLLKDEWVEEVSWYITTDIGLVQRRLNVFGDDGKRYVESLMVPVCPSSNYKIELIDEEKLENPKLTTWTIEGIRRDTFLVFNATGRLINANYIPDPFGILVYGSGVIISNTKSVALRSQDYPTNRPEYAIQSLESTGRDGTITISTISKNVTLNTRPQVSMVFSGRTLFSIESTGDYRLFTEVPLLELIVEESTITNGLELRIGTENLLIDHLFVDGYAKINLLQAKNLAFDRFGTYSVRLYQYDRFIKLAEFTLVPRIESDYSPYISWASAIDREHFPNYRFKRIPDIQMEFEGCHVSVDENEYVVNCPSGMGTIPVKLDYSSNDATFSASLELPIRPFEFSISDSDEIQKESNTRKTFRLGLAEVQTKDLWLSLRFLGSFKQDNYKIILRTVNGIEQEETINIVHSGCTNKNLSIFYDTLQTCPLPAQFELQREENNGENVPLLLVSDTVQLSCRPSYSSDGYIVLSVLDKGRNLTVTSFRNPGKSFQIPYEKSVLGKNRKKRGYKCPELLDSGFYIIETKVEEKAFEFEENNDTWLTNGNDTLYISSKGKGAEIESFSDWLDQLVKDILAAGINADIIMSSSYRLLDTISIYKGVVLTSEDCEKIIALAYFISSKCSNAKCISMKKCMAVISAMVLNSKSRLEIIRTLAVLQCPAEIFDVCLEYYHLLLFAAGSEDAIRLAGQIENYSTELSMLLRMGADDQIRNTIWREKYRELIGKEAIRDFLYVPGIVDCDQIIEEQRKFLREQPSKVKVRLTRDISGEMEPITANMIKVTYKKIVFDKAAKPEIGIYFDRIRYVDQYVNWYITHSEQTWDLKAETRQDISSVVQEYCQSIIKAIGEVKKIAGLSRIAEQYDTALKARFGDDPLSNLKVAIPARFFYIQGLAAFLAKLPKEYQKYEWAVRTGEAFMVRALRIAPRIARRDILMASTYLYLARKEEALCQ